MSVCSGAVGVWGVGWEDTLDLGVEMFVRVSTSAAPDLAPELRPGWCCGGLLGGTGGERMQQIQYGER